MIAAAPGRSGLPRIRRARRLLWPRACRSRRSPRSGGRNRRTRPSRPNQLRFRVTPRPQSRCRPRACVGWDNLTRRRDRGHLARRTWSDSRYTSRGFPRFPKELRGGSPVAQTTWCAPARYQVVSGAKRGTGALTRLPEVFRPGQVRPMAPHAWVHGSSRPCRSSNATRPLQKGPHTSQGADLATDPSSRARSLPDSVILRAATQTPPRDWHRRGPGTRR